MPLSNTKDTYLLLLCDCLPKYSFQVTNFILTTRKILNLIIFFSCSPLGLVKKLALLLMFLVYFFVYLSFFPPLKTVQYFFFNDLLFFEIESHCVGLAGLELAVADQTGFQHRDPSALASWVLELKVHAATLALHYFECRLFFVLWMPCLDNVCLLGKWCDK